MSTTFSVLSVWDLGETIHMIGTITGGVIKGGEVLRADQDAIEIHVASVALGGGDNLPAGAVTLVIEALPCCKSELVGKDLTVVENVPAQRS